MNRAGINEKISAWFEPVSGLELIPHAKCPPSCDADHDVFPDVSPKRHWTLKTRPYWHWAPSADYFTDESANARLLEAMPNVRVTHDKSYPRWEVESDWRFFHTEGIDNDRKTAVVLAFCEFAGIEAA